VKYRKPIDFDGIADAIIRVALDEMAERRKGRTQLATALAQVAEQKYQGYLKR
jgi:hypothetical protein